jgi:hypothetical protein
MKQPNFPKPVLVMSKKLYKRGEIDAYLETTREKTD